MTGNNKVWRAPVAGLASVAMLATMGVAAMTANAATVNANPSADVTVSVDGANVTVPMGSSYADALVEADRTLNSTIANDFGGWYLNGAPVDMNALVAKDAKITSQRYSSGVDVHFETAGGKKDLGYVRVPLQNHQFTVPATLAPYDVADGQILSTTGLTYRADGTSGENAFEYGKTYSLTEGVTDVTVFIPTTDAWKVTFGNDAATGSEGTATDYILVYAGAHADGTNDNNLTVEVPKSVGKLDPATVDAKLSVNLKTDDHAYGVDGWKSVNDFTADTKVDHDFSVLVKPVMKYAFTVTFMDGDDKYATQSVVNGHLATEPTAPSHDASTFIGWSVTKQTGATTGKLWNFAVDKVTGNTTLYAQYANGGAHTLTYKFNDGATEDKVETYRAKQHTVRPEDPTRDGYLFAGWCEDLNGNGVIDGSEGNTEFSFGSVLPADTVLVAKWLKADDATLAAAFEYVDGSDESNNAKDAKYDGIFTEASFKEYVKAYQAVQKEYAKAQDEATAAGTQIPEATLSNLVSELTAAWQKLEFVHEGDGEVEATGLGNTVVHRLSNGSDHFYTQDLKEIAYMTAFQGWTDEGRLFQTAPRADEFFDVYEDLESFESVATGDALKTLDAVADPILTPVTRLYNRANGDHVWSTDANEVEVLSAQADWNNEKTAFYVPTYTGSQPVTRLYKANRHLLSTDGNEVEVLSAQQGWTDEGTAFKAY